MTCKHGIEQRFCSSCLLAQQIEPLQAAWRLTAADQPVVALRPADDRGQVRVFPIDGPDAFGVVKQEDLKPVGQFGRNETEHAETMGRFRDRAAEFGSLFQPHSPLTQRETTDDGPSRCYGCHALLSFALGGLGCTRCSYYVCRCGRCLCGHSGINYRGEYFDQESSPVPAREDRLEYIRVYRLCNAGV